MTAYKADRRTRYAIGLAGALTAAALAAGFAKQGKPYFAGLIALTGLIIFLVAVTGGES